MNRQEALDWCVENVKEWSSLEVVHNERPYCCKFKADKGEMTFIFSGNESITKQDWLDVKADKEKDMIDFSKAPEGSTHYKEEDNNWTFCWYKKEKDTWFYQNNKRVGRGWDESSEYHSDLLLVLKEIPTEQPYTPQIGEECELNMHGYWCDVLLLAYGKKTFIYEILEGQTADDGDEIAGEHSGFLNQANFRPIKTEREKLFDKCVHALNSIPQCDEVNAHHKDTIEWLVDAGFIHAPTT